MVFRRIRIAAISLVSVVFVIFPVVVSAQNLTRSQVVITTLLAPGVSQPSVAPIVKVAATAPSLGSMPDLNSTVVSYASNFSNDTRVVTFLPSGYNVTASINASGYYFSYSNDCIGTTRSTGEIVACTITLSTTPPATNTCWNDTIWNGTSCVVRTVLYQGSNVPSILTCSPSYQTINAGQSATFTAAGGTGGVGYSWKTTDRTSLNVGPSFSTVFQTSGVQTVIVQSGVQNASCTVNVIAPAAGTAITYPGVPSIIANYIPALPNTGFGPADTAVLAFILVLLIGAGIYATPYVRKALTVALG